jgi:hypothetical protein
VHIALEAVGDISHYIHPPPFTVLWHVKEEGEWPHNVPWRVLLPLYPLQLGLHVGHRLHGLHQISINTMLNKLGSGKLFTHLFYYLFSLIVLGS